MAYGKFVCGVGVNDADYVVRPVGGEICIFYRCWADMIKRCYSNLTNGGYQTYSDCEVCSEWLTFSNFKKWMQLQDFVGKELDKDILFKGNRVYSSERCVFVSHLVNSFVLGKSSASGILPVGVSFHKSRGKYSAKCKNWTNGKYEHIGLYETPELASEAWRKRKHELALQLADKQADPRVAAALRTRYL